MGFEPATCRFGRFYGGYYGIILDQRSTISSIKTLDFCIVSVFESKKYYSITRLWTSHMLLWSPFLYPLAILKSKKCINVKTNDSFVTFGQSEIDGRVKVRIVKTVILTSLASLTHSVQTGSFLSYEEEQKIHYLSRPLCWRWSAD